MAQRSENKDIKEGVELILENTGLGCKANYQIQKLRRIAEVNTIFEALGRGSNIKKLDFSSNILADIEITQFETALSENKKIQEINLTGCKLGEVGGKHYYFLFRIFIFIGKMLALGLKKNKGLQNLILANNNIGDIAGSQIIYSVMNNPNLKLLDLAQNKLAVLRVLNKKTLNINRRKAQRHYKR